MFQRAIRVLLRKLVPVMILLFLLSGFPALWIEALSTESGRNGVELTSFVQLVLLEIYHAPPIGYTPDQFQLPFVWMLQHLVVIFFVSRLIWQDHVDHGAILLLRIGSRSRYFGMLYSEIACLVFLLGLIRLSTILGMMFIAQTLLNENMPILFLLQLFSSFLIEDFFFTALVITMGLYDSYSSGIITAFLLLVIASIFTVPYLPGQASIAIRQSYFDKGQGFSFAIELGALLLYLVAMAWAIKRLITKYDFYQQES